MRMSRTTACLLALTASGLALTGSAMAADVAPAADANASDQGLESIIVTAQRRSENVQEVPIVVTALSADVVQNYNIKDMMSLQVVTPGLTMSNWVTFAQTYIRGIGYNFSNAGKENPISVFTDGAYIERSKGGNLELMDVESVQVLKGPQATLWGRNSTGGAILINTADPKFESSGHVMAEGGNQGHHSYEGVLNEGLSDTVAVRVAARYHEDGGYYKDVVNGYNYGWTQNSQVRAKLLYKPSDKFSAVFQYEHLDRLESQAPNPEMLPDILCSTCASLPYSHPLPDYTTAITFVNGGVGSDDANDFYNLKLKWELDKLSIDSVSAYTQNYTFSTIDADQTEVAALEFISPSSNKTFTQTVTGTTRLGGKVESTFGFDFLNDESTYALLPVVHLGVFKTTSVSPFAEVTFKPVAGLAITAGARYTNDKRDGSQFRPGIGTNYAHYSDSNVSPRLVVAYNLGTVNLYASFNRGHNAGGINSPNEPLSTFQKETLSSIEAGLKYLSSDHRVRANFAAFTYDYKDLQGLAINQSGVGGPGTVQQPSAKLHGFEFDTAWEATNHLELFAGGLFEHSEYVNYGAAGVQVVTYDANGNPTGTSTGTESLTGYRLPHAPKFSGFIGANLSGPVKAGWTGKLNAVFDYSDSYDFFAGAGGPLRFDQTPSYTNTRLSASLRPDNGRYEVGFYVDNLTDEKNIAFRFTTAPFGATQILVRPRQYGLRLTANF